jgi:hypothetical protein
MFLKGVLPYTALAFRNFGRKIVKIIAEHHEINAVIKKVIFETEFVPG